MFVQDTTLETVKIEDLHNQLKCDKIQKESNEKEKVDLDDLYEEYYGM